MSALMPLIADLHREALLAEAEQDRRARLALGAQPTPRWRRLVGRAAGTASDALGAAARRLDPTVRPADRTHLDLAH